MTGALRRVWIPAARPKTLAAAVAPVLMGTAIAIGDDGFHALAAVAALLGALLIQIGTNFANDYFDNEKGADTAERLGPTRATATGQVAPATMRRAFILAFALATLCGVYLASRGGWPVVAIGCASVLFGILYTGGPAPLAYIGLADIFVLAFFGPIAVAGTHYVQVLQWSTPAIVAGLAPGLIAVALLTVNNLRDVEQDRVANKRTVAVRFGRAYAKTQYLVCILGALITPVVLHLTFDAPVGVLAASGVALIALVPLRAVLTAQPGDRLLRALGATGALLVLFGLTFSIGWVL